MIHEDLSGKISGAAMELLNELSKVRAWNGTECRVPKSGRKNSSVIYMPSFSYPGYPCNPWLMP
jgi:hypothetical protein